MKRKLAITSFILFLFFLIIAIVAFFLMKNAAPGAGKENPDDYDVNPIVEKIDFLKLNTYEEIKKYAEENTVYIQDSDDKTMFGIGELYIEDQPVNLFFSLNEDGSIQRFDGYYSANLKKSSKDAAQDLVFYFNHMITEYFEAGYFDHSLFGEDGAPIDAYDEKSYELLLNGKATYNLSIIDECNTYWNISATVKDKKQMDFEFFRCFDLDVYSDDSPNIDLRSTKEAEEK